MKRTTARRRRTVITGAAVAAVTITTLGLRPPADPEPDTLSADAAEQLAEGINSELGSDAAGAYYDVERRTLVVNVVNEEAGDKVRAAGAEPKVVRHSLGSLEEARQTLRDKAAIPGTSWVMNPKLNKVVVTADSTVTGAELDRLEKVVSSLGDRAEVRHSKASLRLLLAGGDGLWGGGVRCSLGFNVTKDGEPYFLTAGHCTNAVDSWSDSLNGAQIAASAGGSFPGDDYGIAAYTTNVDHPSAVDTYPGAQEITQADDPIVGQQVQRSGSTSHVRGGEVTGLDATVNYQEGTVEGLIQTTVCAEPGDSGGPLYAGTTGLGLASGGSGDCASGGESFYQPVTEALQATGSTID
ncbi:S1 family peptidase [Streptomyces palmae]|uniref:S1 family peptidase n=1 Tax=Streptomyces palmae TaxID=1701085 RepID=A0A4Z0GW57_9ACTN|nr:S1 family peptidase [Streptomyces palmae]TGB01536.1 S1 family peptidase [Streptomyces palmae]